jgi:hypothetical protein
MSTDLEARLRHYGDTLDRARDQRPADPQPGLPVDEWDGDAVQVRYLVDHPRNPRRGFVAATGLVAAASILFVLVNVQRHAPSDSPTATVAAGSPDSVPPVVPDAFDYFTLDNTEWPLVEATLQSDGSSHLRFVDLVGKQAAGSEFGGGALDLWTGPSARQVIIDNVDSGLFGSPESVTVAQQPATLYSREMYSNVVVWTTAAGADAVLKIEGPREVDYRSLIAQVRGISSIDLQQLIDQHPSTDNEGPAVTSAASG